MNLVVGAKVLLMTKFPVVAVEATAADKSVQLTASIDPCNLNVLVPLADKAQETKPQVMLGVAT